MRLTPLIFGILVLASCGRSEPSDITVELDKPTRVKDCNVWLRQVTIKPDAAWLTRACGVPESAPNWWGEGVEPPTTTILEGDCVRLDNRFYCVEDINPEEMSATLKATYEVTHRQIDHLRPIR
jgi:hypothetical protein